MTQTAANALGGAIAIGVQDDAGRAPVLWADFQLAEGHGEPIAGYLYATAHGIYQPSLNGNPVDESLFAPGWAAYEWRLPVHSYDVRKQLSQSNRLAFLLGNGWWRGGLGFAGADANYGTRLGLLAALEISFQDGHVQRIETSPEWEASTSQITANSLYNGESVDFRLEPQQLEVEAVDFAQDPLVWADSPPVVRNEVLKPTKLWRKSDDRVIVDFGQNLVGWLRFEVQGDRGTTIRLRHAEVLIDDELALEPLREAKATDEVVLSGDKDRFEPTLTFHGFRYAEITGWPGQLRSDDIEAVVVHSKMRRTGWFECSEPNVNQLVSNAVWGQKGNFLAVPTDCPQRDERLGWTGDIAVFAPSACFQYDVSGFLGSWLKDLSVETQAAEGVVPLVVPDVLKHGHLPSELDAMFTGPFAIWGDAAVWVPQALWQFYGDKDQLRQQFPAMAMHLDGIAARLSESGVWDTGSQLGDWLDPDAPASNPAAAKADPGVVATACLYRSAKFAAEAAEILTIPDAAANYQALAQRVRSGFNAQYVKNGRILSDCATVYALAICFGLLDETQEQQAGARLAELVAASDYLISTGFAGTPYVTWALTQTGHVATAYRLLLQTNCPSWLYPVTQGATTIWERWDSLRPDGKLNTGQMTTSTTTRWVRLWIGCTKVLPGFSQPNLDLRPSGSLQPQGRGSPGHGLPSKVGTAASNAVGARKAIK